MSLKNKISQLLNPPEYPVLWTRNFVYFTTGTIVSMLGNTIIYFLIGLLVLDMSDSTGLYALYLATFSVTAIIAPPFAGPILDKVSRMKVIYTLDFISAFIYILMGVLILLHDLPIPVLFLLCGVIGIIWGIYNVAFDSVLPLIVDEKNTMRANSIMGTITSLSMVMIPVATFFYMFTPLWLLILICGFVFFAAAYIETKIVEDKSKDSRLETHTVREYFVSMKENLVFLNQEKGLLAITIITTFVNFTYGVTDTVLLPYFREIYKDGEFIYIVVTAMNVVGSVIAGCIGYFIEIEQKYRYRVLIILAVLIPLCAGFTLLVPFAVMLLLNLIHGGSTELTYNLRLTVTNNYLENERRGRYHSIHEMLIAVGALAGELVAGALSVWMKAPVILLTVCLFMLAVAGIVFLQHRGGVRKVIEYDQGVNKND